MEKQDHREYYVNLQISDFDNDLVGLFIDCVKWLRVIEKESKENNIELEEINDPIQYVKFPPHYPHIDNRINSRELLEKSFKLDLDYDIFLINTYVSIFAICYLYHFPIQQIKEFIKNDKELTRENVLEILIEDGMSPTLHKKPSGNTYPEMVK